MRHTLSTTARGTHYELTVQRSLRRLGFTLTRVGARNDCGIDLVGSWSLPHPLVNPVTRESIIRIPAFVQCKRLSSSKKPSPSLVREVEGGFPALARALAIARAESDTSHDLEFNGGVDREDVRGADDVYGPEIAPEGSQTVRGAIGLLATSGPATKGVQEALARSRVPLGYVQVVVPEESGTGEPSREENGGVSELEPEEREAEGESGAKQEGVVRQLLWNPRAASSLVGEGALTQCNVNVQFVGSMARELGEVIVTKEGMMWDGIEGKLCDA